MCVLNPAAGGPVIAFGFAPMNDGFLFTLAAAHEILAAKTDEERSHRLARLRLTGIGTGRRRGGGTVTAVTQTVTREATPDSVVP